MHIENIQCIHETIMNLQINGYFLHIIELTDQKQETPFSITLFIVIWIHNLPTDCFWEPKYYILAHHSKAFSITNHLATFIYTINMQNNHKLSSSLSLNH